MTEWQHMCRFGRNWRLRAAVTLAALALAALLASIAAEASGEEEHHGSAGPPAATLGGAYELKDTTGRIVTDRTYLGQLVLIYAGYPGCGDACPVALDIMAHALDRLGADADQVQPLFVDISDVKHHHHAAPPLAQWVQRFHPRLIGLTGTRKQMGQFVRAFKVRREHSSKLADGKAETMRINHTSRFYLIGRSGETLAYIGHEVGPDGLAELIRGHF